jgi:hypothetical protein
MSEQKYKLVMACTSEKTCIALTKMHCLPVFEEPVPNLVTGVTMCNVTMWNNTDVISTRQNLSSQEGRRAWCVRPCCMASRGKAEEQRMAICATTGNPAIVWHVREQRR